MPSKSKSQQRLFGMVHQCKKTGKCASKEIEKIAKSIKSKDAKDFAKTKHKDLPEKKVKENMSFKQFLINEAKDSMLYVFDGGRIAELDTKDELAMQRFNNKYGFHSDSVFDFPIEKGVREFQHKGRIILVSDDPQAIAAEVEAQSLL